MKKLINIGVFMLVVISIVISTLLNFRSKLSIDMNVELFVYNKLYTYALSFLTGILLYHRFKIMKKFNNFIRITVIVTLVVYIPRIFTTSFSCMSYTIAIIILIYIKEDLISRFTIKR